MPVSKSRSGASKSGKKPDIKNPSLRLDLFILLEPLPAPLDNLFLADDLIPGSRLLGAIEFCLQIQLRHELFRVDLVGKAVNNFEDFMFIYDWLPRRKLPLLFFLG
jgi:hypothetical protein